MKKSYKIRKWEFKDLENLIKHANNYNVAKFLTNEFPHPYTKQDGKNFLKSILTQNPTETFTIEINGEAAGGISIIPSKIANDKKGELGYWISEKYWNQGIATKAIDEIIEYGFKTFDIDLIYATPFIENKVSQRVLMKNGFKCKSNSKEKIFKNNEIYEVFVFSITKLEYKNNQKIE